MTYLEQIWEENSLNLDTGQLMTQQQYFTAVARLLREQREACANKFKQFNLGSGMGMFKKQIYDSILRAKIKENNDE